MKKKHFLHRFYVSFRKLTLKAQQAMRGIKKYHCVIEEVIKILQKVNDSFIITVYKLNEETDYLNELETIDKNYATLPMHYTDL